jgi:DNA-directed RNA polymerase subunit beta'
LSNLNKIDHIPIKLASPEKILEWSFGEVKKPETINYRTHRPEKGGLFCERIFGPTKDYRCSSHCGNYKKDKFKNKVCPKCGVEATHSRVRRERFGHIKLEAPAVHFWFFRGKENYVSALLDLSKDNLQRIIYCDSRIVIDPGDTNLAYKQLLTETEYVMALEEYLPENGYKKGFEAGIGAKVIREMLEAIDLKSLEVEVEAALEVTKSEQERKRLNKRLKIVKTFIKSGNKPEWMVLLYLPILPPELRPMVQIDGGRFASSDLNELYRKVINRNIRLKKLKDMDAPNILIENEMRLLQESVDVLIANQKTKKPAKGAGNRALKSLEDSLKGKQGRFRQNLLGKRVDYSGRSVIVSGPKLRLNQCGLPRKMAIELFKPFVINMLIEKGKAINPKNAKNKIDTEHPDVWPILEEVTKHHPVLLNRAPTLHKLSIRAFEPIIIEGDAIQLHPLVCSGFNADFDGDQMAVHIPISKKAQLEARMLLLSTENLIHPQNGKSATTPSQDMVLGCYYLSLEKDGMKGQGKFFNNVNEVERAYEMGWVGLQSKIIMDIRENNKISGYKYLVTTPGKVFFNDRMPDSLVYINDNKMENVPIGVTNSIEEASEMVKTFKTNPFDKSFLGQLIDFAYDEIGKNETVKLLDGMMDLGFKYAMRGGLTISLFDVNTPKDKTEKLQKTEIEVKRIERLYAYGRITDQFRYDSIVKAWNLISEKLAAEAYSDLMKQEDNPIAMMIGSGARGSNAQYRQLAANRGLMADPNGKTIETPIRSNFSEGLTVFEYFISTHGSRKGMVDTALKTANSGYLTRRMVDVAQDVVITEEDCGTNEFFELSEIKPRISSLEERLFGRILAEDVYDNDGKLILARNEMVDKKKSEEIASVKTKVKIRSVVSCHSKKGICQKCYGMDMATREMVETGESIGVIAAQSIGEPGTQLTMRTFHTGGVASEGDITQGLPRIEEVFEARKLTDIKIKKGILAKEAGKVSIAEVGILKEITIEDENEESFVYQIPYGYGILVKDGDIIEKGEVLTSGPVSPHEILAIKGMNEVKKYLLEEIQRVYKSQGVTISDKHIEVIIRQMTKRVMVRHSGDSNLVAGRLADKAKVINLNKKLQEKGKREIEYIERVQGITESSLTVESFLSASSFERTSEVLSEAAIRGKKDKIRGLKESVILGKLIPSGTGYYEYKKMLKKN